jgi:5-methylcytosine-specific restriction endonuclease McrA
VGDVRTPEEKATRTAYNKAYYQAHKEEMKVAAKAYNEAHRELIRAKDRARYWADPVAARAKERARLESLPEGAASYRRAHKNRGRAKARGYKLTSGVSAKTYGRIMAGGPGCTYCPAPATHVDHVYPFARGGAETDENLVPACAECNMGKTARLLTEWAYAKVVYGAAHSPKVAAELARLMAEIEAAA